MQQLLLFKWILQDGETLPLLSLHNLQEEAIPFDAEEESSDDEEEEDEDGDDEDDKDDCIGCKAIFRKEGELLQHIVICDLI